MLEFFKLKQPWKWAAFGKHPVAADYFAAGDPSPILNAFSSWVEKGYQSLKGDQTKAPWNSFRFWIKGPKKDLIMGTLHDSSDRIGRKFPLLIIGTGPLGNWEKKWEGLPSALDKAWTRAEYLACKRYSEIKMLESDILAMPDPAAEGGLTEPPLEKKGWPSAFLGSDMDFKENLKSLLNNGKASFQTAWESDSEGHSPLTGMHHLLKSRIGPLSPTAAFTTLASGKATVVLFRKPLTTDDFLYLVAAAK